MSPILYSCVGLLPPRQDWSSWGSCLPISAACQGPSEQQPSTLPQLPISLPSLVSSAPMGCPVYVKGSKRVSFSVDPVLTMRNITQVPFGLCLTVQPFELSSPAMFSTHLVVSFSSFYFTNLALRILWETMWRVLFKPSETASTALLPPTELVIASTEGQSGCSGMICPCKSVLAVPSCLLVPHVFGNGWRICSSTFPGTEV